MKTKFLAYLRKLGSTIYNSTQRFPETLLMSALVVVMGIYLNHTPNSEIPTKIIMAGAMGIPLSAILRRLLERFEYAKWIHYVSDLILLAGLVGLYVITPQDPDPIFLIRYFTVMGVGYLIFTIVPYFYKKAYYATYCLKLVTTFFATYLYTLILFLGLVAIVFTVDSLFELQVDSEIYLDMFFLATGIFGVAHFLGSIPKKDAIITLDDYPKILKVLFVSIVMPLLSVYTVILYAYFLKIMMSQTWPENLVGNLVVWYGIITMVILFSVSELEKDTGWVHLFKRFMPLLMLLPVGMLFATIYIRLSGYGLTPARYYVVLFAVWFVIMIGHIIFKKSLSMTFYVTSLCVLVMIGAFGPVNAFTMSINSQNNRFEKTLIEFGMLQGDQIVPNENLADSSKEQVMSYLTFFDNLQAMDQLKFVPNDFALEDSTSVFGFEYQYGYYPSGDTNQYFSYYNEANKAPVAIKGADFFANVMAYPGQKAVSTSEAISLSVDLELNMIGCSYQNKEILSQEMVTAVNALVKHLNETSNGTNSKQATNEEMTLTWQNDAVKITWVLNNLSGRLSEDGLVSVDNLGGFVFVDLLEE